MAVKWRQATLDQLGRIVTGKTPSSSHPEFFGGDIPFVTPTDLDGRRIIDSTGRYVTEEGASTIGNPGVPAGAVMVSCIGSDMGKAAVAGEDCITNQQINSIIVDPPNNSLYVYYDLSRRKAEIRAAAGGSAQPILNKSAFGKLEILLPSPDEQRAIAHILGTLDDKIELNRRMNETLEAMARALFKSWFVDFDPVCAKAAGRDPGLPKDLAGLFPGSFDESDTEGIPTGWHRLTLAEFALLNPEVWSREARPAVIRYVDLSNTKMGQIEEIAEFLQAEAPSRAQRVLRPGDTIVGTVRPGNSSYAYISEEGLTGSTGFAVLRPRTKEYTEFVYLAATAACNIQALAHLADGAAYPAVRPEVVAATPVVAGAPELFDAFAKIARPVFAGISLRQGQTRTIAALRDALLPKLISGELRVTNHERILTESV